MIEVKNLIFDYPHFRALKDISFTISEGTITALVGPNGAGKTTLFNCIAGLEQPFSGSVMVDGVDASKDPRTVHKSVGFLPDFFGLYETLTVRKSLHYFAMAHKIEAGQIEESIERTAKRLGIFDKIDGKVSALSRGMRQRLAIGQVVIGEPKVLLLDEPASGLDPEARFHLGELFKQLKLEGMTLLVSSHILAELEQYADELLIIREGELVSHSASNEAEETNNSVIISLASLSDCDDLETYLKSFDGLEITEKQNDSFTITIPGDTSDSAYLLKELIMEGFEVYSYAVEEESMQKQYMNMVQKQQKRGVS